MIGIVKLKYSFDIAEKLVILKLNKNSIKKADQLPSLQSIKDEPKTAKVPDSAAGICMVVYRTLASIESDWINAWMDYMPRLDVEAQGMFANGVRAPKYSKQPMVMQNRKFTTWAKENNYMFQADKS